jgi:hypothetical protein
MFVDEFSPVFQQLTSYPIAFMGGFVTGLLRLSLNEDPVQSWLNDQAGAPSTPSAPDSNGKGPQTISIE